MKETDTFDQFQSHLIPRRASDGKGHRDRFFNFILYALFAYPLLWMIGFGGLIWIVILPAAGLVLLQNRLPVIQSLLVAIGLVVLASIPIGLVSFGFEAGRVIGAVGNISVWLGVAAISVLINSSDKRRSISSALIFIGVFQGALTGLAIVAAGRGTIVPLPLLSQTSLVLPSGLSSFASADLYYMDWLDGAAFRSSGLMGNPTWAGAFAALSIYLCLERALRWDKPVMYLIFVFFLAINLALSLSRSATITVVAAILASGACILFTRKTRASVSLALFIVGTAIVSALYFFDQLSSAFVDLNAERKGSLVSRSQIYSETIQSFADLPIPLLGYGIKPQIDGLVASLATHSTYLGLLFRGGLIAACLIVAVIIVILLKLANQREFWLLTSSIFIVVWCSLEDFDGGHLVPVFLAIAISKIGDNKADVGAPNNSSSS